MSDDFQATALTAAGGSYELRLRGRVYADTSPTLRAKLDDLADKGLRYLVVDATALEQIDSSGLNVFVHLLKRVRPLGGKIVFHGLNPNVRRVFDITKLDTVMGVEDERAEALRSLEA